MEMICINCPNGCRLNIEMKDGEYAVSGNLCPRGKTYAINELTHPMRTLTSTVTIENGVHDVLPVISNGQLPKDKIVDAIKFLANVRVEAPVQYGDIVVKNILDLGVDIIASRDMDESLL